MALVAQPEKLQRQSRQLAGQPFQASIGDFERVVDCRSDKTVYEVSSLKGSKVLKCEALL